MLVHFQSCVGTNERDGERATKKEREISKTVNLGNKGYLHKKAKKGKKHFLMPG